MVVVGALVAVVAVVVLVVRASRPTEPVETGPVMTTVTIVSDPAGATVKDADGGLLGVAPFDLIVPKREVELPVVVSREGYQDSRITVPLTTTWVVPVATSMNCWTKSLTFLWV